MSLLPYSRHWQKEPEYIGTHSPQLRGLRSHKIKVFSLTKQSHKAEARFYQAPEYHLLRKLFHKRRKQKNNQQLRPDTSRYNCRKKSSSLKKKNNKITQYLRTHSIQCLLLSQKITIPKQKKNLTSSIKLLNIALLRKSQQTLPKLDALGQKFGI